MAVLRAGLPGTSETSETSETFFGRLKKTLATNGGAQGPVSPGTFKLRQRDSAEREIMLLNPAVLPRIVRE